MVEHIIDIDKAVSARSSCFCASLLISQNICCRMIRCVVGQYPFEKTSNFTSQIIARTGKTG
jgi:hypothetical protein